MPFSGAHIFLYAALVFAPPAAAFDKNVRKCLYPYIFGCYNVQNAFGGFFMNRVLTEQLIYEILSVVEEIPEGCVASYGRLHGLSGEKTTPDLSEP